MANTKEVKRRIKSVKNIGQITKALQMVSAVKMRKAQANLESSTPYFKTINSMFEDMISGLDKDDIQTVMERKRSSSSKPNIGLIMISPSKGFAGPLISNLTRKTYEFIDKRSRNKEYEEDEFIVFKEDEDIHTTQEESKVDIKLITVEKKSKDFAVKLNHEVIADFPKLSSPPSYADVVPISDIMTDSYKNGSLDEVYIVYTHFLNTFTQRAVIKKILPFNANRTKKDSQDIWYSYSSKKLELFRGMYTLYIQTLIFHAVLDAVAAEHSARMIAMKNATDNANDVRRDLTIEYNQRRQAAITQEIAEITSAADAL